MSSKAFLETLAKRRTYYQLGGKSPISDARVQEIIKQVILNVPSAFNSQTVRVVLLVKDEHRKLWDIATEVLKSVCQKMHFLSQRRSLTASGPHTEPYVQEYSQRTVVWLLLTTGVQVLFFDHRHTISDFQGKVPFLRR